MYEGYNTSKLEMSMKILSRKSSHSMDQRCLSEVVGLMDTSLAKVHIPENYHQLLQKSKDTSMDV